MKRLEAYAYLHGLLSGFESYFLVDGTVSVMLYWLRVVLKLFTVFAVSEVREGLVTANTREEVADESSVQVPP